MKTIALCASLLLIAVATPAAAADVSTHVLDLARGHGSEGVPVTLSRRSDDGHWLELAAAKTDAEGRIRTFGESKKFETGVYRLRFDLSGAPEAPFFPEITLTFRVTDAKGHFHVPVVVSPFGYSTYRGS